MDAPTASELQAHPVVQAAMAQAWVDSQPADRKKRHEEGGWIFLNMVTGELFTVRAPRGVQTAVDLAHPPTFPDSLVVGTFHTHPNPTADGWFPGPSIRDKIVDAVHGVPDLIQADNGVYHSGPDQRRGGLTGNPGFPA
jgi:hypothetical protein